MAVPPSTQRNWQVAPKDAFVVKPLPMLAITCAGEVLFTTLEAQMLYAIPSAPMVSMKNWIVGVVPVFAVMLTPTASSVNGPVTKLDEVKGVVVVAADA